MTAAGFGPGTEHMLEGSQPRHQGEACWNHRVSRPALQLPEHSLPCHSVPRQLVWSLTLEKAVLGAGLSGTFPGLEAELHCLSDLHPWARNWVSPSCQTSLTPSLWELSKDCSRCSKIRPRSVPDPLVGRTRLLNINKVSTKENRVCKKCDHNV